MTGDHGGTAWFLAHAEASAKIDLTRSLVLPIALTGGTVGVMMLWIDKLRAVFSAGFGIR